MRCRIAIAVLVCAPIVRAQELPDSAESIRSARSDLCRAQDKGEFTVSDAIRRLGGNEQVARTAASIVRNEWVDLPDALFAGLDQSPKAARRFLEELARAPRPDAREWVVEQSRDRPKRTVDHRLLALAARMQPITPAESLLLIEALRVSDVRDGFFYVASQVPEQVADRLVGRVHQLLMQQAVSIDDLGPLLDRLSARGTRSLLGLAMTLPLKIAHPIMRHVHEMRPQYVEERVVAALDGEISLDSIWLQFAGKLIDRPSRIDRVTQVMLKGESAADQDRAFEALLSSGVVDERLLAFVADSAVEGRILRVIAKAADQVPTDYVVEWLQSYPRVVEAMARALSRRQDLERAVQSRLLDILDGIDVVDRHTPLHALTALVHGGDAHSLKAVWPLVLASPAWMDLLGRIGRRNEPFLAKLLQAELSRFATDPAKGHAEIEKRQQQHDMLRLLSVARGDRRELEALIANAPNRTLAFLRRCRQYLVKLSVGQAHALCDAALASEDTDVASELLEWVFAVQPEVVDARLWDVWCNPSDTTEGEELREVALRFLVRGMHRQDLVSDLREALAQGPLADHMSSLPYEALNSMVEPLCDADVALLAEIILKMPLEDAAGERRLAKRWPDGSFGFPLVAVAANRLRNVKISLAAKVFTGLVDELEGDRRCVNISRQRLHVFWRSLAYRPDLQRTLGSITSRLWNVGVGAADVTNGAASWLQARWAEGQGEFAIAEGLYRQAGRDLLRLSSIRPQARWLLGDRDPVAGQDPWSALSAAPYRMRLLAARAAGDEDGMEKSSQLVREFAGHDRATLATLMDTPPESIR